MSVPEILERPSFRPRTRQPVWEFGSRSASNHHTCLPLKPLLWCHTLWIMHILSSVTCFFHPWLLFTLTICFLLIYLIFDIGGFLSEHRSLTLWLSARPDWCCFVVLTNFYWIIIILTDFLYLSDEHSKASCWLEDGKLAWKQQEVFSDLSCDMAGSHQQTVKWGW